MRQANFARKKLRHNCDPQSQHKKDVGDAHAEVVRQLIRFPTDLIHVKSNWKDDSSQAEENHGKESEPPSKFDHPTLPVGESQQHNGDVDTENPQNDANKS